MSSATTPPPTPPSHPAPRTFEVDSACHMHKAVAVVHPLHRPAPVAAGLEAREADLVGGARRGQEEGVPHDGVGAAVAPAPEERDIEFSVACEVEKGLYPDALPAVVAIPPPRRGRGHAPASGADGQSTARALDVLGAD